MLILVNLWITLAIGLDTLADTLAESTEMTTNSVVGMTWTQDLLLALMAFIGIGWLVRRDWRHSLKRLGLVLPTWWQALLSVVLAGVFVVVLILMEWLFAGFGIGFDEDVQRVTETNSRPADDDDSGNSDSWTCRRARRGTRFPCACNPALGSCSLQSSLLCCTVTTVSRSAPLWCLSSA